MGVRPSALALLGPPRATANPPSPARPATVRWRGSVGAVGFGTDGCVVGRSNARLLNHWESALRQHSRSRTLWANYLSMRVGHFASFRVSTCVEAHTEAVRALAAGADPADPAPPALDAIHRAMVCYWNAGTSVSTRASLPPAQGMRHDAQGRVCRGGRTHGRHQVSPKRPLELGRR